MSRVHPNKIEKSRVGFKWNMNEINRLYNEYEIKKLDVYTIAELHRRDVKGILYKLADEGIIQEYWEDARGWVNRNEKRAPVRNPITLNIEECWDTDSESEVEYSDSDEEYTLQDAEDDYDPYSFIDKINFFKSILPSSLFRS
uniref:Uncharacterized protein n=1 Tax=viral metagenome TaxID=1070528 RepID=A0A6C0KX53_9ZZZZ